MKRPRNITQRPAARQARRNVRPSSPGFAGSRNVILLVLLLAFAAVMVAITKWATGPSDEPAQARSLWASPAAEVLELTVRPAAGQTLAFKRENGTWTMTAPQAGPARPQPVEDLIEAVQNPHVVRAFDPADPQEGIADAATGLGSPAWTVTLTDRDGTARTLYVGQRLAPVGVADETNVYVRPEGRSETFVVEANLPGLLGRDLASYRKRSLLSLDRTHIARIDIQGMEQYTLRRTGQTWQLLDPQPAKADPTEVRKFLGQLADLRADRIVTSGPHARGDFGLHIPRLTLTVTTETPQPTTQSPETQPSTKPAPVDIQKHVLRIGSQRRDEVFLSLDDAPTVYALPASTFEKLAPEAQSLLSPEVLDIQPDAIDCIRIDQAGVTTRLQRKDGRWEMTEPQAGSARDAGVDDLLTSLDELKADKWLATKTAGVEITNPRATITLTPDVGDATIALRVGSSSPTGKMVYLQVAGSPRLAAVPQDKAQPLLRPAAFYWPRRLLDLPRDDRIDSLTIDRPDGGHVLARNDQRDWLLVAPLNAVADKKQLRTITSLLRDLRATQIVSLDRAAPDELHSAEKRLAVQMTVTSPTPQTRPTTQPATATATAPATQPAEEKRTSRTVRLIVVRTGEGTYAWLPDAEPVAVGNIPAKVYDALAAELRDRNVWSIEPADVTGIDFSSGRTDYTLQLRDGEWTSPQDPALTIYKQQVDDFLADLETFRALDFASYDSADAPQFGLDEPAATLTLTFGDDSTKTLKLAATGPDDAPGRFTLTDGVDGVFVAPARIAELLAKPLTDFAEKPAPKPDRPTPPGMPGRTMPIRPR